MNEYPDHGPTASYLPPVRDDGRPTALAVALGLLAGLAVAVLGLFTFGRLTISSLGSAGTVGLLLNAVGGAILAAAIGGVGATVARRLAEQRDRGPRSVARSAWAAGGLVVLIAHVLPLTTPLRQSIWLLHLAAGVAAVWWVGRQAARRGTRRP